MFQTRIHGGTMAHWLVHNPLGIGSNPISTTMPQFFRFSCGTAYGLLSNEEKRHPCKRRRSPGHVRDSGAPSWEAWLWETCACSLMAEPQTSNLMVGVRFSSRTPHGCCGGPRESFEVPKALVKRYIRPTARPVGSASTTGRRIITVAGSGLMCEKTDATDAPAQG